MLALGNGGSATDATDFVADLARAGHAAIDLSADPAILTAIANDVGVEAIFARQVIALRAVGRRAGRAVDERRLRQRDLRAARGALARARHRRASSATTAGRSPPSRLADHVVVVRSQHIPRIQEAQASAYHVLCELIG